MNIEVHLFANLASYLPTGARRDGAIVDVPDGATVEELLRRLAIPEDLPRLMLVNGQDARPDHRLRPGDVVSVLPPLVGG